MHISFDEINLRIKGSHERIASLMSIFISEIQSYKEIENLPIYSIKHRIKDSVSAYLKTKRKKYNSTENITDIAGIRLLCLFENDLLHINSFLLKYLSSKGCNINEIKVFNYGDEFIFKIKDSIDSAGIDASILRIVNKPGYRSLHYSVSTTVLAESITIEFQARTLLQDVWGELEHSLSYKKGAVHPHIKKSFELLSRDLETSDMLMSHLKDIFIKEQLSDKFLSGNSTPRDYLGYESCILPDLFSTRLKDEYEAYDSCAKKINLRDRNSLAENISNLYDLYNALCSKVSVKDNKDAKLIYWTDMEQAFFYFCNKEYDKAIGIYNNIKILNKDKYCVAFRLGEIYFINGDTSKALIEFDEAIQIIQQLESKDARNIYIIKLIMALSYWILGDEYIDIAIENIIKCKYIYETNEQYFAESGFKKSIVYNNYLWYHLAKFAYTRNNDDYAKMVEVFDEVADTITGSTPLSSNSIDTLAWFYYNKYLHSNNKEDLLTSLTYCNQIKSSPRYSTYNYMSLHVQMNHVKEIINAASEAGILAQ